MYTNAADLCPDWSLFDRRQFHLIAVGAGLLVATAIHAAVAGGWFLMHASTAAGIDPEPDEGNVTLLEDVIEARFVRLGQPLDPNELPNRRIPLRAAAPNASGAPTDQTPDELSETETTDEPIPEDADEADFMRDADLFAEEAEQRELEGDPSGIEDGTETEASEGDVYAGRLRNFFREGWTVPTTVTDDERHALVVQVSVDVAANLRITGFRIRGEGSGNATFDGSVSQQFTRLMARGATLPEPPESVAPQYVGRTIVVRMRGRDAN